MRVANEVEGQWPVANRVDPFPVEINILEAISKLPQCNQDASKVKESLVDLNFSFPTNNQSSEVLPPGKSRLNLPSTPVRPQFATILIFLGLLVFYATDRSIQCRLSTAFGGADHCRTLYPL